MSATKSPLFSESVHFPKLAVVNLIGRSRCSIQSLAVEPLITFPIRLQIVPRWTWKPVLAGGSPLAVVKVSHPKGVEDRSGDLIYKGDHIYKDEAAVSETNFHDNSPRRGGNRDFRTRSSIVQSYKTGPLEHPAQCHSIDGAAVNGKTNNPSCELIHHHQNPISS